MEKFLSIPVTGSGDILLNVNDVISVTSTATGTTTVVTYLNGNTATITAAAQVNYSMRKAIQDAIVAALSTSWTRVTYSVITPQAVSGIVIA
jgi:steroid 5-alpha reductase family enzyme